MTKTIKLQLYKLRKIIYFHNYQYYIINNPLINNEEYDLIFNKLTLLENNYNKLNTTNTTNKQIVIDKKNMYPIRYHFPMLSINTIFYPKQLNNFFKSIHHKDINNKKIEFCCELKIDGVAINLIYKNQRLIFAGTRGDGYYGENITQNIFLIPNIPKYLILNNNKKNNILPEYCEIRGEIFIHKKDFDFLQKYAYKFNIKHLISNSRNLAYGLILKNKYDICSYKNIVPHKFLNFYAYNLLFDYKKETLLNNILSNQWNILNFLKLLKFQVCKYSILDNSPQNILLYYKLIKEKKHNLSFEIDGIVIKVNNFKLQKYLGRDIKYHKWAIALKFPPNNKITYIRNIQWHMSRNGVMTPIALISPITIEGTTINKINVHNLQFIKKLDLRLNDAIMIYKAGEVIPKLHYVIKSLRLINKINIKTINIPSHCKFCKSLLRLDYKNNIYCTGNSLFCKEQLKYKIKHFISKYAFNIKFIGENIIDLLIENKYLSTPVDLFFLSSQQLLKLSNLGQNKVNQIIKNIKLSKIINFSNFIYSLGIPNIGWLMAKKLAFGFNNCTNLFNCKILKFQKITGLKGQQSEKIYNYVTNKYVIKLVITLLNIYKLKIIY